MVKSVLKLVVIVHWESAKPQLLVCNGCRTVFSSDLSENSSWESGDQLNSSDETEV